MRTQLQSSIDDLETANEEMKSAAEEYQSVNEELQSSNEELETSKEEMQSINEELQTVNAEMNSKNDALTRLNSDLKNLLDSTQIATMFLDSALRVKNYTPGMTHIFHLRESDRGRPVTEIVTLLAYDDIVKDVAKVVRDLSHRRARGRSQGRSTMPISCVSAVSHRRQCHRWRRHDLRRHQRTQEGRGQKSLLLAELDHRVRTFWRSYLR